MVTRSQRINSLNHTSSLLCDCITCTEGANKVRGEERRKTKQRKKNIGGPNVGYGVLVAGLQYWKKKKKRGKKPEHLTIQNAKQSSNDESYKPGYTVFVYILSLMSAWHPGTLNPTSSRSSTQRCESVTKGSRRPSSSTFLRCPQSCWWLFRHISSRCSKTAARTLHTFLSHQMQRSSSAFCSMRWLHNVSTSVPKNEAMEIVTTFLLHTGNAE